MKYIRIISLKVVLACYCLLSCSQYKNNTSIAIIGDEPIYDNVINHPIVENAIYDELCRIYDIRLEATREYVGLMLLKKSAEENFISIDSLLASYCQSNASLQLDEEGLRKRLIDSLFICYDTRIILKEPIAPIVKIENALIHEKGCLESKIIVTEISDFDCGLCSYMHKEYSELHDRYGDRVKFLHSTFSSEVSPSSRAAYAAGLQDRYWEMADSLFAMPVAADSSAVMDVAMVMGLDMDQFIYDYTSAENYELLMKNNAYLSSCGVKRTPTILINGHPLRYPDNIDFVNTQINRALDETN